MNMEKFVDMLALILDKGAIIGGIIFVLAIVAGITYRIVKNKPYEGTPPVGIMNDLPGSVTGINKYKE